MDEHLDSDQIDELLQSAPGDKPDQTTNREHLENAREHLKDCASCQARLRTHEQAMERLALLNPTPPGSKGPICPPDDVWLEIAAGIGHEASENLSHAAECDHCGPLLRQNIQNFANELTQDEESMIADLPSSTAEWRNQLAVKVGMAPSSQSRLPRTEPTAVWWRVPYWPVRLAFGVALAAVIALVVWLPLHKRAAQVPEQLIAAAYAEKRTVEVRMEGAPYAELRQGKGDDPGFGRMSRPALLNAEKEIAQHLSRDPDDVTWLQASGRASMLDNDPPVPDSAVAVLERARRLAPDDTSVQIDLASAYILRYQLTGAKDREDSDRAIEILEKLVRNQHANEVAQFNYAIALEEASLNGRAVDEWKTFLDRYPKSPWVQEARERLSKVQQEIRDQKGRSEAPLNNFEQVASAFKSHEKSTILEIDARIEEYQDQAVQNWLPQRYSADAATSESQVTLDQALNGLAQLLSERHSDPWLKDMMHADRHSPTIGKAVRLLGKSVSRLETSDESQAQREATSALLLFRRSHLAAGAARAEIVLILAEQFEHRDRPCERMAQAVTNSASVRRYAWVFIQARLESGLCASVTDKKALQAVQSGIAMATTHGYPILALRAITIEADLYSALGDTQDALAAVTEGLRTFWLGTYPKLRGYNLLVALDDLVIPRNQWFLESAILKEALPMVDGDPRTTMVAVEEARLAQTLLQTGDLIGADDCYQQTERLLQRSAPGLQREALSAEAELGFAKVDLKRNRLSASLDRLQKIRHTFMHLPDDLLVLDFYQTSGIAQLRSNHLDQAERDLDSAVHLAEKGLRLVDTENDRWKWSHRNEPIYRALVELKLHTDPRQALLDWEWYKGSALRGLDDSLSGHEPLSSSRVSASEEMAFGFPSVNDRTAVVSFVLFPRGLAVWVWDHTGSQERWIPLDESTLSALVTRFLEHCSDPRSDPSIIREESREIYQRIIAPIEPLIAEQRNLIVEPDGVLKALPMELLVDSNGEYFGDRFGIAISPGLFYLNRSRVWAGISTASDALVLGNPKVPGWIPLPNAEQEARTVAALFSHPRLLLEGDIPPEVLAHEIAGAQVFHFSGHAQASIESAALVSGATGMLDASQLDVIDRGRSELVVLSACSSSRGTTGLFDDDDSIVRRLMAARVPEVVASRWTVDSAATAVLMKAFYAELLTGRPVSGALESAERTVRADSQFSHPYYWAAFSVFGRS